MTVWPETRTRRARLALGDGTARPKQCGGVVLLIGSHDRSEVVVARDGRGGGAMADSEAWTDGGRVRVAMIDARCHETDGDGRGARCYRCGTVLAPHWPPT